MELTVPEEEPIGSFMTMSPPITSLVTGDPAAEPGGVGGGADSAGGRANRKPEEYCPTNHTLLQGILPLNLVERVVELTVRGEEPTGSLMSIVRPITRCYRGSCR